MDPGNGLKLITPKITGLDNALENSENTTVSELATVTCTFFLKYTGKVVDNNSKNIGYMQPGGSVNSQNGMPLGNLLK